MRRLAKSGSVAPPLLALLAAAFLGGCVEPYEQPAHWDASQVNQLNLAAQVSDWHDLLQGHGDPGSDGQEAAAAVDRLRKGNVKALVAATVSDIASQGGAGASQSPAPSPAGN